MPKPAARATTPPAEFSDRSEGWGRSGRVQGYPEYRDDGIWPDYPGPLSPSGPMKNRANPDEPPETSDRDWYRVERIVEEDRVVYNRISIDGEIYEGYAIIDLNTA